ncbi:Zn-dependent exopeptidase, partial [Jaminaea rosea]
RLESLFLSIPSPESAKETLRGYTTEPHIAGGDADYRSALQVQKQWASLLDLPEQDPTDLLFDAGSSESQHYLTGDWKGQGGYALGPVRVWTDTYHVWLNDPQEDASSLSLGPATKKRVDKTAPTWEADLREDTLDDDPTSVHRIPAFHGYSKPGSASGPLVFAGYCSPSDFALLKKRKIPVKGAITLCRYGGLFRGLKVLASYEAGAVGTLIFSDPIEDGNVTEANGHKAYPDGPARQATSIQRGSVQALSAYPGDPGTPGRPSYKNATRLDARKADSLPKIPSLPISYKNAARLFAALKGKGVNSKEFEEAGKGTWLGAIPDVKEYWTGPTPEDVVVKMNNAMTPPSTVKPIWNSYALIPGVVQNEVVVLGSHRDAWSCGAGDPSSGAAAVHEVVAGFGALLKTGWRPLRSILVTSWDAEEYGLVGSTEFGEDYAKWLQEHAVAYLNTDVAASGTGLKTGASPLLAELLRGAARNVTDPNGDGNATIQLSTVKPLGSGSDFSVFLQHLGIPSSDIGYAHTPGRGDPVYHYHSQYDSFSWMEKYGDPEFKHITTIAKVLGLAALRVADGVILPFSLEEEANTIAEYVTKVEEVAKKNGAGVRTSGGCHGSQKGKLDFTKLHREAKQLQRAAQRLECKKAKISKELEELFSSIGKSDNNGDTPAGQKLRRLLHLLAEAQKINTASRTFEHHFIHPKGLKGRPWYRSLLVAPGRWLGYGATPLPGLTEAITLDGGEGASGEVQRL